MVTDIRHTVLQSIQPDSSNIEFIPLGSLAEVHPSFVFHVHHN